MTIQCEMAARDAVGVTADQRAEIEATLDILGLVVRQGRKSKNDIGAQPSRLQASAMPYCVGTKNGFVVT